MNVGTIRARIYNVDDHYNDITYQFDYYTSAVFKGEENLIIPRVGEFIEDTTRSDCRYQVLVVIYEHTYNKIVIRIYVKKVNLEKVIKELSPTHKEEL